MYHHSQTETPHRYVAGTLIQSSVLILSAKIAHACMHIAFIFLNSTLSTVLKQYFIHLSTKADLTRCCRSIGLGP